MSNCGCSEGTFVSRGQVHASPPVHDCRYIRERNRLIPLAVAYANSVVPSVLQKKAKRADKDVWSLTFLKEMDRLWKQEAGT